MDLSNKNKSRSQSLISVPADTDCKFTRVNSALEATLRKKHIKVVKTNEYGINTVNDITCLAYYGKRKKETLPSRRMTAPDPLSNTSAIVASEVSLPENVFYLFIYLFNPSPANYYLSSFKSKYLT